MEDEKMHHAVPVMMISQLLSQDYVKLFLECTGNESGRAALMWRSAAAIGSSIGMLFA
jgi:hypothetical protein